MAVRLVLILALTLLAAAPAHAATSAAVYSDPEDFLGQGRGGVYGADQVRIEPGTGDGIEVIAGGWRLVFAAPPGERLEPRNYIETQRVPFRENGHAGLSASTGGRACNTSYGRFEVLDLVRRDDGSVRRLWIVFQHFCEGSFYGAFGEIRVNVPATAAANPGIVRWPENDPWMTPTNGPVRYEGAAPLAATSLAGDHPGDYFVDDGGCRTTPCTAWVSFRPKGAGSRTAVVRFTDTAGAIHDVALQGFAHRGVNHAVVEDIYKPDHEPDRAPRTHTYDVPTARFAGHWYGMQTFSVYFEDDVGWWEAYFYPGAEGWQAGKTYTDTRVGLEFDGNLPAMEVRGRGTPCNHSTSGGKFTLHSHSRDTENDLRTADVSFEQPCGEGEQRRPALRGRVQYRAGDDAPFADWLIAGPRPGLGPMPPELPPPATTPTSQGPVTPPGPPGPLSSADSRRAAVVCGRRGFRRVAGTRRADRLRGSARTDRLLGRGGPDRLLGRGGNDCLHGGAGGDRLHGGHGRDSLFGGAGDDLLVGGPGADVLDCGAGRRDRATAGPGDRTRGCERVLRAPA
jgi:hypothetical protein